MPSTEHARAAPGGTGFATAALALGAAGVTLVAIVPALVFGVLGLRRAGRRGPGAARCWLGIALAAVWAVLGAFLMPHLVRAADPGCAAYKGPALTAYNKVISDFSGRGPATVTRDLSRAIAALNAAAAHSRDAGTSRDLGRLTAQLRVVLAEIRAAKVVPGSALSALNHDAARTDSACGTLRI